MHLAARAPRLRSPLTSTLGCASFRCRCLSALLRARLPPCALRVPSAALRGSPRSCLVSLRARLRSAATCVWHRRLRLQLQFTASAQAPYFGLRRSSRFTTSPRRLTCRSTRTRYGKAPWPRSALCHHAPRGQGTSPSLAAYLNVRPRKNPMRKFVALCRHRCSSKRQRASESTPIHGFRPQRSRPSAFAGGFGPGRRPRSRNRSPKSVRPLRLRGALKNWPSTVKLPQPVRQGRSVQKKSVLCARGCGRHCRLACAVPPRVLSIGTGIVAPHANASSALPNMSFNRRRHGKPARPCNRLGSSSAARPARLAASPRLPQR